MPASPPPPEADNKKTSAEGIAYDGLLPAAAAEHIQALEKEYGAWVATKPIHMGAALAFNPGAQVPASHVERFELDKQGLVAKAGTKDARRAQGIEED